MSETAKPSLSRTAHVQDWIHAIRPVHWFKNLLLFAPVVFAQAQLSLPLAGRLAAGMALMSLAASAGYLFNDLVDAKTDQRHPVKQYRPVAMGSLRKFDVALAAFSLAAVCVVLAAQLLGAPVALLLSGYLLITICYSTFLKQVPVLDVMVLGLLYVWRMIIGGVIADISLSTWLLAFGYSLFVGLALVKRMNELVVLARASSEMLNGRAYRFGHLSMVRNSSVALAASSIAVLALYVGFSEAAEAYYHSRSWLWVTLLFLGLWLLRIVHLGARGQLGGDPVIFAVSDPTSLAIAAVVAATLLAAT